MALDFPSSPTNGQIYGNYYYDSTTGAWRANAPLAVGVPLGGAANSLLSKTTSTDYDTRWVTDVPIANGGTGSTLGAGLVPVVPTSISVSSGSSSVSSSGLVTYSGVGTVALNGVFSSQYAYYRAFIRVNASAQNIMYMRFRSGGSTISGAGYTYSSHAFTAAGGTGSPHWGTNLTYAEINDIFPTAGGDYSYSVLEFLAPTQTGVVRGFTHMSWGYAALGAWQHHVGAGAYQDGTSVFDGFLLGLLSAGTHSGNIKVYGYPA
jgi:hypothetical protein